MATRAHSTRTPLSSQATGVTPLLQRGFGTQPGPVTLAIRAMRAAEPKGKSETISHLPAEISELRRRIADRIEADLALLDALDGDCNLEDDDPAGGDVCDEPHDPEEDGDDHEQHVYVTGFDGTNYKRGRS